MAFQAQWCDRCRNYRDRGDDIPEEGEGCPIWDAHVLFLDAKKPDGREILDHLIDEDLSPPCRMFEEDEAKPDPHQGALDGDWQ